MRVSAAATAKFSVGDAHMYLHIRTLDRFSITGIYPEKHTNDMKEKARGDAEVARNVSYKDFPKK